MFAHGFFRQPAETAPVVSTKHTLTRFVKGDNLLHNLVRFCKHPSDLDFLILLLGKVVVEEKAKEVNDLGQLPIDVLQEAQLNEEGKKVLFSALMAYTLPDKMSNPWDQLNLAEVLRPYIFLQDTQLFDLLCFAAFIVNETRKVIKFSYTHPQMNTYGPWLRNGLFNSIEGLRAKRWDEENSSSKMWVAASSNRQEQRLKDLRHELVVQYSAQTQIGNCYEFSHVALELSYQARVDLPAAIYEVGNGDHLFLILDHRVVCDPWAGKVYLLNEINEKLKNYKLIYHEGSYLNVLTSYNANYHYLVPHYSKSFYPEESMAEVENNEMEVTEYDSERLPSYSSSSLLFKGASCRQDEAEAAFVPKMVTANLRLS